MDPITASLLAAGIGAAGSIGGGILSRGGNSETKLQKQQRKLIDDLLLSLQGKGSYNDLFSMDENAFQKSYVDPAKALFKNQIAPQIQQGYIASGQQRGSGLDDTLTRAGVDLDQLLNQQYGQFQENALNRKSDVIGNILRQGAGAPNPQSFGSAAAQATGGYLSSPEFRSGVGDILEQYRQRNASQNTDPYSGEVNGRKGYAQ